MPKKTYTVVYPAMLQWLATLDNWSNLAQQSTAKAATQAIWDGDTLASGEWCKQGHHLLTVAQFDLRAAHTLIEYIESGFISPTIVAKQLEKQNWNYKYEDEDDENEPDYTEYCSLKELWATAMGSAMIMTKTMLSHDVNCSKWLSAGMDFFLDDELEEGELGDTLVRGVDESHTVWLRGLCRTEPWAQDVVAQWLLNNGSQSPQWPWAFDEKLGKAPTVGLLCSIFQAIAENADMIKTQPTQINPQLMALGLQAPCFLKTLLQAERVYASLCGPAPGDYLEQKQYIVIRDQTLSHLFPQAMEIYSQCTELADNSPKSSIGQLFD